MSEACTKVAQENDLQETNAAAEKFQRRIQENDLRENDLQ